MKNFSFKRFTAALLFIVMIVAVIPASFFAADDDSSVSQSSVLLDAAIFFSDLHTSSSDYKEKTLKGVLEAIQKANPGLTFTSITSGGDAFSVNADSTKYTGKTSTLNGYIQAVLGNSIDINYTWSDHDRYAVDADDATLLDKTSHLSYGAGKDGIYGTSDDDNYYVYTLSMADLCSYDRYSAGFNYTLTSNNRASKGFTATVELAIEQFVKDAESLHKDRPLFIVSHQPLFDNRNDNAWAEDWFDAINKVAEEMDVAFFYGHNHNYDSGSDYYYAKGSTMPVATQTNWNWNYETGVGYKPSIDLGSVNKTLNFTHMCAGYLAPGSTGSTSSTTREGTALAVKIYDDSISYVTYNSSGVYTGNYAANYTVKREHAAAKAPDTLIKDSATGVSVSASNITSLTVNKVNVEVDAKYHTSVSYDINPEGYTQGTLAAVTVPVDTSVFDVTKPVHVLYNGEIIAITNIANGKVTFTTHHFSVYTIAQTDEEITLDENKWVTITEPSGGTTTYTYTLDTDGTIDAGAKYLIVSGTSAMTHNGSGTVGSTTVSISNNTITLTDDSKVAWTFSSNNGGTVTNNGYGLRLSSSGFLGNSSNTNQMVVASKGNGGYTIQRSGQSYYVRFSGNSWSRNSSATTLYLYKCTGTTTTGGTNGLYAQAVGGDSMLTAPAGSQETGVINTAKQYITVYTTQNKTDGSVTEINDANVEWTAVQNATDASKWTVTVSYQGKELKKVEVNVNEKDVKSAELVSYSGTAERNSNTTDTVLRVTFDDDTTADILVNTGMITAGTYDITKNGTYTGLTISYDRFTFENYTLKVVNITGVNDFPAYPNAGSIKVDKFASGLDFQNTGLAQVQLSTSGLPVAKGVDVIIMLDLSSSMDRCVVCGQKVNKYLSTGTSSACTCNPKPSKANAVTRIDELHEALLEFEKVLDSAKNKDSIKVAIAGFNGFYSGSENPAGRDTNDNVGGTFNSSAHGQILTGSSASSASTFVSVSDLNVAEFSYSLGSGTNYDHGMDMVYQLGTAIKAENKKNNQEDRELFVLFMSDGASNQFNFFSTNQDANWNDWLNGKLTTEAQIKNIIPNNNGKNHYYYYDMKDHDGDGNYNEHRMANAIKGDPNQSYEVIRKSQDGLPAGTMTAVAAPNNVATSNLWMVPGLGAKMYSIAFYITNDGAIEVAPIKHSLEQIATNSDTYIDATTEGQLAEAFKEIATDIIFAATSARFVDQLGSAFELQMNPVQWSNDSKNGTVNNSTDITIITRPIYTKDNAPTTADIGKPYGDGTLVETVSFDFGTNPTPNSTLVQVISSVKSGNILNSDGVICAQYFFYNTTQTTKEITLADGSKYKLPGETFYWNIGTINETQFTLKYTVYLSGALDKGKVPPADSYATNNFAILYYTNYVGNEVSQSVPSPNLAWSGAKVSYAFYLVNENGKPVHKDGSLADNFYTAYKVTRPIVYNVVELNNNVNVIAGPLAADVLPEGYKLYAEDVQYEVGVASGKAQGAYYSYWNISNGKNATYVTGYGSADDYTNVAKVTTNPNPTDGSVTHTDYDYANTTVWFPVLWIPSAIPDSVVIDFGISVDIHVLDNDQFGTKGELMGFCSLETALSQLKTENGENVTLNDLNTVHVSDANRLNVADTYPGKYGDIKFVNGNMVRYTLRSMIMTGYERFVYEVAYPNENGVLEYYYGIITIIPATTIYYEENFVVDLDNAYLVDVSSKGTASNPNQVQSGYGAWTSVGSAENGTQGEDRPGQSSLSEIDADFIYGFDSAYEDDSCKKYSFGAASMVTVHQTAKADDGSYQTTGYNGYAPKATFTFTGTGFDIISLTDSDAGMILVTVKQGETTVRSQIVANYYGMNYQQLKNEDGTDMVDEDGNAVYGFVPADKAEGQDTIWQVPVIKMDSLTYGTYTVEIQLVYMPLFDLDNGGAGNNEYNFILDAIRIYDPANDGVEDDDDVIEDAYKDDNEYNPQYFLLRDMLASEEQLNGILTNANGDAVVFIDGKENASLALYENPGPNNEVYLLKGQSIAFNVAVTYTAKSTAEANIYSCSKPVLSVGAKIAYGSDNIHLGINETSDIEIKTATDMYYTLPLDWSWTVTGNTVTFTAQVVLTNTTAISVLSLTNIKITENVDETVKYVTANTSEVSYNARSTGGFVTLGAMTNLAPEAEEAVESVRFYADQELVDYAVAVMAARFAPAPEVGPEVEPEVKPEVEPEVKPEEKPEKDKDKDKDKDKKPPKKDPPKKNNNTPKNPSKPGKNDPKPTPDASPKANNSKNNNNNGNGNKNTAKIGKM